VAQRIYDICTQEYGVPPSDLLFDPLVFPVTTGQEDLRNSAVESLNAIKRIKAELPGALTHVGLSNVSFGLHPYARQVVNSVFLHYCLEAGLDSAILHAAKIIPLARIDEAGREFARRLIFNDRDDGDPLQQFMEKVEGAEKGKIVLATVKGDVHDIGKNLVDIILTNNGYKVFNLGIKQPVENMIRAFEEHRADAIGMSGLLVKSTVVMKEDL